jgi:hypothetical protein
MLQHGCLEAATSEERRVRQQLKALLEATTTQQVESSASRQHLERGRAGASSAHGPTRLPLSIRTAGKGRGRSVSGQEPARD